MEGDRYRIRKTWNSWSSSTRVTEIRDAEEKGMVVVEHESSHSRFAIPRDYLTKIRSRKPLDNYITDVVNLAEI